jgi:sarcosine oxidase delta subunit
MDDIDYKYRRPLTSTWRIQAQDDPNTAYATELRLRIVPSPRDITRAEIVDSWLVWLHATEGKRGAHRVFHWARGCPQWLQAQREGCSEATIANRIDRSMAAILNEFLCTELKSGSSKNRPTSRCARFTANMSVSLQA